MVAASKLRQIQPKAENSRGLWQPVTALLGDNPSKDIQFFVIYLFMPVVFMDIVASESYHIASYLRFEQGEKSLLDLML